MSVIFALGPHHGRVPSATGNTSRRYVDATSSITAVSLGGGEYAVSCSGTTTISNFVVTTNTLGATTQFVGSGKLRFPSALPSTSPDLAVSGSSGGDDLYFFFQQSSSKLAIAWGAGTPVVSSSTVTFDTDYTIDVHVDRGANPNVVHWWIDGVAQTDCSAAQASGNITGYTWGRDSAATGTYYWRDVRASVTAVDAPLSVGKVHILTPSGTATEIGTANSICRFTSNGGGLDTTFVSADIMAAISEIPPVVSAAATGLYQRTSGTTNAISIPMSTVTIGSGTVELCVVRVLLWSASATANNLELRAWDGTNETTLIAREDPNGDNSTTTPAWWCATYTPSGGWDQTKLDAFEIRIGYSNDVSPVPGAHFVCAELSIKAGGSGSSYNQSVSGTTAPTGTLVRATSRTVAGATVPTGMARRALSRSLTGSTTPTGTACRAIARALSGATTPTGVLTRALARALGGSTVPTGTASRATTRALAGSVTPAGTAAKGIAKSLAGSTTPTGTIARAIAKTLTGSTTPSGLINRALARLLGGSTAPTGTVANDAPTPPPEPALLVAVDPPSTGWATSGPAVGWRTGRPSSAWTTGMPEEG